MNLTRIIREYLGWILDQSSRLSAVIVAACVFIGLSVALGQANRQYSALVNEVESTYLRQEAIRQEQFMRLRDQVQGHLDRMDKEISKAVGFHQGMYKEMRELIKLLEEARRTGAPAK